jgi:hypothetical protein
MNKTQKIAWFTLGVAILLAVFGLFIFRMMFTAGSRLAGTMLVKVWIWVILVFSAGGAALVHWKRKPSEVNCDERDNSIKKNAVLVSFVSLLFLLFAASIIPSFIVSEEGSIPVCLLPIINFGVFLLVMLVCSLAVLVQYGWGNRKENL